MDARNCRDVRRCDVPDLRAKKTDFGHARDIFGIKNCVLRRRWATRSPCFAGPRVRVTGEEYPADLEPAGPSVGFYLLAQCSRSRLLYGGHSSGPSRHTNVTVDRDRRFRDEVYMPTSPPFGTHTENEAYEVRQSAGAACQRKKNK